MNARVIAIDVNAERLKRASEFGADALINPGEDDPLLVLRELTDGIGVDCALDTSGASSARIAAVRATKIWGVCCFVGEGGDVTINVSPDMIRRQMTIIASWTCGVREVHGEPQHRRRPHLHQSLVARSSRRSLSAV